MREGGQFLHFLLLFFLYFFLFFLNIFFYGLIILPQVPGGRAAISGNRGLRIQDAGGRSPGLPSGRGGMHIFNKQSFMDF